MNREPIATDAAPAAIGPYSQAIRAGGLLFCSGQIALSPADGTLVGEGDVRAQTEQVMKNLGAILEAGGATFGSVVKTTIYIGVSAAKRAYCPRPTRAGARHEPRERSETSVPPTASTTRESELPNTVPA